MGLVSLGNSTLSLFFFGEIEMKIKTTLIAIILMFILVSVPSMQAVEYSAVTDVNKSNTFQDVTSQYKKRMQIAWNQFTDDADIGLLANIILTFFIFVIISFRIGNHISKLTGMQRETSIALTRVLLIIYLIFHCVIPLYTVFYS